MSRPAGIPNKNKRGLRAQLKQQYGDDFDVIMMMAEHCNTLHKIAKHHATGATSTDGKEVIDALSSAKEAISNLDKLAQYVEPKLKAVELTGEDGEPIKSENRMVIEFVGMNANT